MPKVDHGLIWSEDHADKSITIGFTRKCIEDELQETFHVFPAETKEVREKGPLLVLETNDGIHSIKAPFAGKVSYFNPKARNFPDKIKESETIVTILPKDYVAPKKVATKFVKPSEFQWAAAAAPGVQIQDWLVQGNNADGFFTQAVGPAQPAAEPPRQRAVDVRNEIELRERQRREEQRIQDAVNRLRRPTGAR